MRILHSVNPRGIHCAEIEGAPDAFATGKSEVEAVGNLVLGAGHIYGVEVIEKKTGVEVVVCVCPADCDCADPTKGRFSQNCPVHNEHPDPYPECRASIHRGGQKPHLAGQEP